MKKLLTILLLLTCGICSGQNLVPNSSFEDTIGSCPTTLSGGTTDWVTHAAHWKSFNMSPDYFNSCAPSGTLGVPNNVMGYQNARTGNAYCGFMTCHDTDAATNAREYLGCQLISNLVIGQKYFVSINVVRTEAIGGHNQACNKLGVKFTTYDENDPEMQNSPLCNNYAHVWTDSVITDSINWTRISGSFIADSVYKYIIIGNFFKDNQTIHTFVPTTTVGYYLVDDICVSTDSLSCYTTEGINELNQNNEISLFPNPFTSQLTFQLLNNEQTTIILYDLCSRQVLQQTFTNKTTISTEQLAKGMYLYEVRNKTGIIKNGKVIKQ